MATPIFRVDLSPGARDYEHMATEPGLPMLDQQQVNFGILRGWFGDLVAEPQWEGQSTVSFFARQGERGQLSNIACRPTTKADLEGQFAEDLQKIRSRIRKIKPESSTEQLLHRIVKESFHKLTNDLEVSDYDSFFMKIRTPGEPWRLVWCWGYQRTDQQPSPALICPQKDCHHLFVRRPKTAPICPLCQMSARPRGLFTLDGAIKSLVALLLLLLLLYFVLPPQLTATPGKWSGPAGSRIPFEVKQTRLFFFSSDVTKTTIAQSHDSRIVEFEHGVIGKAKNLGETFVTFRHGNQVIDVAVRVGPLSAPDSIQLDTDSVKLAVGSTYKLKAEGLYPDGTTIDVTDIVIWSSEEKSLSTFHDGFVEGVVPGTGKLIATYPAGDDNSAISATADLEVIEVDFTSLAVGLDPGSFGLGESAEMEVYGMDKDNNEYSLTGSSLLLTTIQPPEVASIDVQFVKGRQIGSAELIVVMDELSDRYAFEVGVGSSGDLFSVAPTSLEMLVDEYFELEVINGTGEEVTTVSSDPTIAEVLDGYHVAGRGAGSCEITLTCGGMSEVVKVEVVQSDFTKLYFNPYLFQLDVGETRGLNLFADTEIGKTIEVVPDRLTWIKQPLSDFISVNRNTLTITGIKPTLSELLDLEVSIDAGNSAIATIEVVGGGDLAVDSEFGVYPPIDLTGRPVAAGTLVGDGLVYNGNSVVMGDADPFSVIGSIPSGSTITTLNGDDLTTMDARGLQSYFAGHPIVAGDVIQYRTGDGALGALIAGGSLGVIQDFKVLDVTSKNVTPDSFSIELKVFVRVTADYRLADENGDSYSDWKPVPANSVTLIVSGGIPRNSTDEYDLYLDREAPEGTKRFQIPFKLTNQSP